MPTLTRLFLAKFWTWHQKMTHFWPNCPTDTTFFDQILSITSPILSDQNRLSSAGFCSKSDNFLMIWWLSWLHSDPVKRLFECGIMIFSGVDGCHYFPCEQSSQSDYLWIFASFLATWPTKSRSWSIFCLFSFAVICFHCFLLLLHCSIIVFLFLRISIPFLSIF